MSVTYSREVVDTICERLAKGEGLRAICADPAMPSRRVVQGWLKEHPEITEQYAQAMKAGAERRKADASEHFESRLRQMAAGVFGTSPFAVSVAYDQLNERMCGVIASRPSFWAPRSITVSEGMPAKLAKAQMERMKERCEAEVSYG